MHFINQSFIFNLYNFENKLLPGLPPKPEKESATKISHAMQPPGHVFRWRVCFLSAAGVRYATSQNTRGFLEQLFEISLLLIELVHHS